MFIESCGRQVCPYCEEYVSSPTEVYACCGEVHTWECGSSDAEGHLCTECRESEAEAQAKHMGIVPGMSKAERQAQLEAVNPYPATDEEMAAWQELKS
jgi:hypothetical protein